MLRPKWILVMLGTFGLLGCATILNVPTASDSASSALCISLWEHSGPHRVDPPKFNSVLFIKLPDSVNTYKVEEGFWSNFRWMNQYYLLDPSPGRYAVAVGSISIKSPRQTVAIAGPVSIDAEGTGAWTTYFPLELIKLTEVVVDSGEMAFMGDYRIKTSRGVKNADEVQQHYHKLIAPDYAEHPAASRAAEVGFVMLTGVYTTRNFYLAKVKTSGRNSGTEIKFLARARKSRILKRKGWLNLIDKRLTELQAEE